MSHPDPDKPRLLSLYNWWNKRLPTTGYLAFAAFIVAVVSGIILAVPYDIDKPVESIQVMLLTNSPAAFFRTAHYWSAQVFFVLTILHVLEYMLSKKEKEIKNSLWVRIALTVPAGVIVMLTGFILKGDAESFLALRIFDGLLHSLPRIGEYISFLLLGNGEHLQVVYVHHIATTTIYLWIVIAEHARKSWPTALSMIHTVFFTTVLSLVLPVYLHSSSNPVKKGPWYFVGLQEMLHWTSQPVYLLLSIFAFLSLFLFYPRLPNRYYSMSRNMFALLLVIYAVSLVIGWFFRGAGWQFTYPWQSVYPDGVIP